MCCALAVCSSQAGTAFAPPWARLAQRGGAAAPRGPWPRAAARPLSICMLNRAKKNALEPEDESLFSARSSSATAADSDESDFSAWAPSRRSKEGVFISAADEVQNWISRALLTHNEEDRDGLQAIIDEFRTEEELVLLRGGVVGDIGSGPASWVKQDPNRDIDPSGVVQRAVENIGKAKALNMSYVDYVAQFVIPSVAPTVETIQPNRRQLPGDALQLVTAPFRYPIYSLLPRVPYCTCWYGLYLEVEAIDHDVEILGLFSQSGEYWRDVRDRANITVFSRAGVARGYECAKEEWQELGSAPNVRLPRANFTSSSTPLYGRLPMNGKDEDGGGGGAGPPIALKAGETRAFLIMTTRCVRVPGGPASLMRCMLEPVPSPFAFGGVGGKGERDGQRRRKTERERRSRARAHARARAQRHATANVIAPHPMPLP